MPEQAFLRFIDTIMEVFDKNPYQAKMLLEELLQWLNQHPSYQRYTKKVQSILQLFDSQLPIFTLKQSTFTLPYLASFVVDLQTSIFIENVSMQFLDHEYKATYLDDQHLQFQLNYAKPGDYAVTLLKNNQAITTLHFTIKSLIEMDDLGI
jgi:hypothetical protein